MSSFIGFPSKVARRSKSHEHASTCSDQPAPMSVVFKDPSEEATIRKSNVVAAYISAYPPFPETASYNVWAFFFRTKLFSLGTIQVTLEELPRAHGYAEYSDTYIQVCPGPPLGNDGRITGMSKTFKISTRLGSTIGDFLEEMVDRKLHKIQLSNSRGKRDWANKVLREATRFFNAREEALTARNCLLQGWEHEFPIRPGDCVEIAEGNWLDQDPWGAVRS